MTSSPGYLLTCLILFAVLFYGLTWRNRQIR